MRTRRVEQLRPQEILAEIERCPVVYWPLGLIEWHGPHLPTGTDALNAEATARLAAKKGGGLVMPPLYGGTERERPPRMLQWLGFEGHEWIVGMDFPANTLPSLYIPEEVFALIIRANLPLLADMGFQLAVLLTGHAAENQLQVLEGLAAEFNEKGPIQVLVALPFTAGEDGVLKVGHASRVETAAMMALHPEAVDLDALPPASEPLRNTDWAIVDYATFMGRPTADHTVRGDDDPRYATARSGQANLERAVEVILAQVKERVNEGAHYKHTSTGGHNV
jgi:creatinine amidohydrolase